MAAELVVPSVSRANRPLAISGTGWQAESPVRVSLDRGRFVAIVTTDLNGDFNLADAVEWQPDELGRFTVTADDGTDNLSADVMIFSTT